MLSVESLIYSFALRLMDIPKLNIIIAYILRPIFKHRRIVRTMLNDIIYSKILDYGCGEGLFSNCFVKTKYIGYDPAVKKIIQAKKIFSNYKFLSEIPDFHVFDLFFFNSVFHHMKPNEVQIIIENVAKYAKHNSRLMIIELKPIYQQTNFILKLILHLESRIHYSEPRAQSFYEQEMQNQGFALTDKKDLGAYYLLLYKK